MKKLRPLLCAVLCAALIFSTACGKNGNTSSGTDATIKGRYIQKDITPAEAKGSQLSLLQDNAGNLIAFSADMAQRFDSKDNGATWTESVGPGAINPALANISNLSMDESGNLYGTLMDTTAAPTATQASLVKILPDGTTEPLTITDYDKAIAEGETPYPSQFKVLPGGRLLLSFFSGSGAVFSTEEIPADDPTTQELPATASVSPESIATESGSTPTAEEEPLISANNFGGQTTAIYDISTGEQIVNISNLAPMWGGYDMVMDNNTLHLINYDGSISSFSLSDLSSQDSAGINIPINDSFSMRAYTLGKDGTLYAADCQNFYSIDANKTESVMSPTAFSFGNPNSYISALFNTGDKTFVMGVSQDDSTRIYEYKYDANATVDPAKTLNVWSLYNSNSVRAAITAFMQSNPDATVNYHVAQSDSSAQNIEDAIKTLNTEILSGKGPDVLVMDGLSIENYAGKGALLNLQDAINTQDVFPQVLAPFKENNSLYSIPMRFKVPLILGDSSKLNAVSDLNSLVAEIENGPDALSTSLDTSDPFAAVPEDNRPTLTFTDFNELFTILWQTSASKIITSNGIDEDALRTFLSATKAISDKYQLATPNDSSGGFSMAMSDGSSIITGSAISYMMQQAQYGALTMESIGNMQMFSGRSTSASFPGLCSGTWMPSSVLSVNANSKVQDLALSFLQEALSQNVQSSFTDGMPVTQQGVDDQIAYLDKTMKDNSMPEGFSFDMAPILENMQEPSFIDSSVAEKMNENTKAYCEGTLGIDETVSKINDEFRNYLAERE